jgi:hypothetical protein
MQMETTVRRLYVKAPCDVGLSILRVLNLHDCILVRAAGRGGWRNSVGGGSNGAHVVCAGVHMAYWCLFDRVFSVTLRPLLQQNLCTSAGFHILQASLWGCNISQVS